MNFIQWIPVSKWQFTRRQINRYTSSFFREDPMGLTFRKFDHASLLADVLLWLRFFPYSNVGIVIGWLSSTSFSRLSTVTKNKWRARGRTRKWILALEKQTRNCITYFSCTVVLRWNRVENLIFASCEITERKIWFIIKSITDKDI